MATSKYLSSFLVLFSFILFNACAQKTTPVVPDSTVPPVANEGSVFAKVVDYSELDGCTWILELSDGQKVQPVNLPEEFKRKELKLFVTYKFFDGSNTCMTGRMVTITSASIAKEDKQQR